MSAIDLSKLSTHTLAEMPVGSYVLVRFTKAGHQVAYVEAHTRTGKLKVRGWRAGRKLYSDGLRTVTTAEAWPARAHDFPPCGPKMSAYLGN